MPPFICHNCSGQFPKHEKGCIFLEQPKIEIPKSTMRQDIWPQDGMSTTSITNNYTQVNDSGKREEFSTGSVRDTRDGKGRFDLVPISPLRRLAKHYENGAKKYGERNWEKGQPSSRYYDSAMRHLLAYMEGDRSEDHLAAVAWNAFAMIYNEEHSPHLNDINDISKKRLYDLERAIDVMRGDSGPE